MQTPPQGPIKTMENVRGLVQHLHLTHLHIWLDQNASVPDSPHWLKKSQKKDLKLFTFHPVYKPSCRKSSNCSWVHFLVCVISELITIAFHVRCCHCGYKPKDKKERSVFAKLMTCEVEDERVVGRVLWGSFDNMFGFVRTWKENLNVNVEVISDFVCSFPLCVSVFVFFFPSLSLSFLSLPLFLSFLSLTSYPSSHFSSPPSHILSPSSHPFFPSHSLILFPLPPSFPLSFPLPPAFLSLHFFFLFSFMSSHSPLFHPVFFPLLYYFSPSLLFLSLSLTFPPSPIVFSPPSLFSPLSYYLCFYCTNFFLTLMWSFHPLVHTHHIRPDFSFPSTLPIFPFF